MRASFALWLSSIVMVAWACSASSPMPSSNRCAVGLDRCGSGCIDPAADPANCGGCGRACATGQLCQASACQCLSGLTACATGCSEVSSDPQNCGACGNVCAADRVCSLGSCEAGCAAGLTQCGQSCVNPQSSVAHCGVCNNACPSGLGCANGACGCPIAGQMMCGGQCADIMTSPAHCGMCGRQCAAGEACQAGVCSGAQNTGGNGGGGAGGGGGSGGGPGTGDPGVVVSTDAAGTLACVPLCLLESHPDDPDTTDDWAYEGTTSCVLPNSPTGTRNQPCVVGQPLPPTNRDGFVGVVVDSGGDGTLDCVPLCGEGAMPSSPDPANPTSYHWGWEYQASCIIIATDTAVCNQTCITGQALPSPTLIQRPGVLIAEACTALCTCNSAGTDPDWGWEFQTTCVMAGSDDATGKPACTTNDGQDYTPPPLTGTTVAEGFYTEGGRLYDAYGNQFVMRGVNNPHIWFDPSDQNLAYLALDAIKTYETNTIRVVWETTGGSPALLARILYRIVELDMVPMLELHDATGATANNELAAMAAYYAQPDVSAVLQDFRAYALINIANEWSGNDFRNAYQSAITTIRNAGLSHTLVIDANGFGQNADAIFDNASALMTFDPEQNLLFSVHMYSEYPNASSVDAVLNQAVSSAIPLIVGEFGPQLQGQQVAWQQIMSGCQSRGLGYIAWSWSGNDSATANLNIVNNFGGSLTPAWGQRVMVDDPNSIQNTAQVASIFQ